MHNSNYLANTKLKYIILIVLFMSIKIYLCILVKNVSIIAPSILNLSHYGGHKKIQRHKYSMNVYDELLNIDIDRSGFESVGLFAGQVSWVFIIFKRL